MRLTQMDAILIRMLYLAAAGIVVLTVVGANTAASMLFNLTFVLVVLLWCAGALRSVTWTDAVLILTVGLALSHVIINAFLEQTQVSFGYFKKYLMFICTLVYFQAAYKLQLDDKTEKFLLRIISILAVCFIVYFYLNPVEVYMMRGRVSNYLTFGFTNPNLTAMFLLCIYTGELFQLFRSRNFFAALWHLALAVMMGWFIWETESRNCLMTLMLETVLCILLYLTRKGFRLPKWFSLLIAVWPILFALAYVAFIRSEHIQQLFSFMASEGKGLDARVSIWMAALQHYSRSPIFGAYSQISQGTGISQMHNTHMDILASYGTVILVLVCYLLYSVLRSSSGETKADTMKKICFAGTIIMGMGEASLFSGGLGIYLFAGAFLLLCSKEQQTPADDQLVQK